MQLVTLKFQQIVHASLYHTPPVKKLNRHPRVSDTIAIATGMKVDRCQSKMNIFASPCKTCGSSSLNSRLGLSRVSLSTTFSFAFYSADGGDAYQVTQPREDAAVLFDPQCASSSSLNILLFDPQCMHIIISAEYFDF